MHLRADRRQFLQSSLASGAIVATGAQFEGHSPARSAGQGEAGNPRVPPGQVRWHGRYDEACRAARRSGKPVFLFHMMGRLDQQFC
jgi:hypothetical protein